MRKAVAFSAGGDGGGRPREHDYLERWCGGRALPWHRADLGFFGAHALSRCARVARMDSCDPLLATHFLLEKQVEARRFIRSPMSARASRVGTCPHEDQDPLRLPRGYLGRHRQQYRRIRRWSRRLRGGDGGINTPEAAAGEGTITMRRPWVGMAVLLVL